MNQNFEIKFAKFAQELESKAFMEKVAKKIVQLIYGRVKMGKGVSSDSMDPDKVKEVTLKALSDSYVAYKKRVKKGLTRIDKSLGSMVRTTSKSNLTFTGEMLEALTYEVGKGIRVYVEDSNRTDGKDNKKVAGYASEERPFLALTQKEFKIIQDMYKKEITRLIRRIF